jgi:hypothetical protein
MSEAEADRALRAQGWKGTFTRQSTPVTVFKKPGFIEKQAPNPGTQITDSETVTIYIGRYTPSTTTTTNPPDPPPCCTEPRPPRLRQWHGQPIGLEIEIATVTVITAAEITATTTPPGSAQPETGSSGIPGVLGLVALLVGVAAVAAGIGWFVRSRSGPGGPPPDQPELPTGGGLPGIRSVRVGFSDGTGRPIRSDQPLQPGRRYRFWVDIGELPGAAAALLTVPLQVVLFDGQAARRDPLILDQPHQEVLLSGSEVGRINFEIRTPEQPQQLRLRCGLYSRGTLLQTFAVTANVAPAGQPGGWRADRDYVTSFGLDPAVLSETQPHALSLMINHNAPGEHGIYAFFGERQVVVTSQIPAGQIEWLQQRARTLYAEANATGWDHAQLPRLLAALALHGWNVFTAIQPHIDPWLKQRGHEPAAVWDELLRPARIQVVWPADCAQPLPAAVIYDYPLTEIPAAEFRLCAHYFADLGHRPPRCLNGKCLSASDRVVCPAGFWGFRLEMGSPLSLGPRLPIPDRRYERAVPPTLVLGKSTDPAFTLRDGHLKWLRHQLGAVTWHESDRVATLLDQLRHLQPTMIYLYCHGGFDQVQGIGWVEIGDGERLSARGVPRDFGGRWRSGPLVLLNGCSTAALGDGQPNPLAHQLLWAGASGAVGTEIDINEPIACAFADRLVLSLLNGASSVGEALREARITLLQCGSAAGLSYLALAPADLRLVTEPRRN